jgi:RNA polymerase sigma-70 factor (ECF subfamily)
VIRSLTTDPRVFSSWYRWNRRETTVADDFDGPSPDRVALAAALARLPTAQRRAMILYYLAGLTTAEVARECHAPESTVRSWLHRGRMTLMTQLAEEASR